MESQLMVDLVTISGKRQHMQHLAAPCASLRQLHVHVDVTNGIYSISGNHWKRCEVEKFMPCAGVQPPS